MQTLLNYVAADPEPRVSDLMHTDIVRVRPDATARQGIALLAYYGLTSAPVADRTGRLVGLLTAADILHLRGRVATFGTMPGGSDDADAVEEALDVHRVAEIMLPALFTVESTATISELADRFETGGIDRVFVVSDEKLVGVVTTTDLLQALAGPESFRKR